MYTCNLYTLIYTVHIYTVYIYSECLETQDTHYSGDIVTDINKCNLEL